MKLFVLIYSLEAGGAERVTTTLANHWCDCGWDVTIATLAPLDKDFYALRSGVRRLTLNKADHSAGPLTAAARNLARIRAVRRLLASERPDAALGMMTTASCLLALASRNLKLISVGAERVHPPRAPLGSLWRAVRWYSYGQLDVVVAQSQKSAQWLREHTRARHVTVIPNPVEVPLPAQAPVIEPATCTPERLSKRLLAVGRLTEQKRFDRLIRAFAEVAPGQPEWQLAILGEGPLRPELAALVEELGLTERVIMPGVVGNVSDWYVAANAFALTSAFEGFPNTLLEAMAHGLAVVSTDCATGPRDIVRDGVDGLLVAQDDRAALVAALGRLMGDAGLRGQLARRAREAQDRFSVAHIAGQWQQVFTGRKA